VQVIGGSWWRRGWSLAEGMLGVWLVIAVFAGQRVMDRVAPSLTTRLIPTPDFEILDATKAAGLTHMPEVYSVAPDLRHIEQMLNSFGNSIAVADLDGDGWQDIYLTQSAPGGRNELYVNQRDGTFRETAVAAGVGEVNTGGFRSLRAMAADCDNDGHKDLFVIGAGVRLFHNRGDGRFDEWSGRSSFAITGAAHAANVVDFDDDGRLDLIVAPYFARDVVGEAPDPDGIMPDSFFYATNGAPVSVFHNEGDCRYVPQPGNLGIQHRGWTHTVGVYDLRDAGRPDLWFSSDFSSDKVYLNDGRGGFSNASDRVFTRSFSRNGMGFAAADIDGDERTEVFVPHIMFRGQKPGGNMLWGIADDGSFADESRLRGVKDCGWGWGGIFADLNNDSRLDLIVGNGFISNNAKRNYWYQVSVLDSAARGVMTDARNWPPMEDSSMAGYQRACIFVNEGSRFVDVRPATLLADDDSDERATAMIDFRNDGNLGFVVGAMHRPTRLYEIRQLEQRRWVGYVLRGTRSNRDGYGATLVLELADGRTLRRQFQPLNGFLSQHDGRLHVGLGEGGEVRAGRVRWPSGIVQELTLEQRAPGAYHEITETAAPS